VYDDAGNELTAYIRDPVPRLEGDVSQLNEDYLLELVHKHSAANVLDDKAFIKYSIKADSLRADLRDLQAELNECKENVRQHLRSRQMGFAVVRDLEAAIELREFETAARISATLLRVNHVLSTCTRQTVD
jgi:hypothetical protein